jgi:crotonobetainyl-CoA:carnitine CoA-transferase CaiB-like acyl-CoA transferase
MVVDMSSPISNAGLPLEGIRAVCVTGIWAGPYANQLLADWGCEVIQVESTQRRQLHTRGYNLRFPKGTNAKTEAGAPWPFGYPNGDPGEKPWNRASEFNSINRNKLGMTVDLTKPRGMQILHRLVGLSDLFIENNTPSTLDKLGITYEWLIEAKPDIIMIRMPAFGLSGPYRNFRTFGSGLEATIGFTHLRGYTDLDKTVSTTAVAHCDATAGTNAALAALMALLYRKRTGKGQLIELAQVEGFIPQLGEAIMDYTMNGRDQNSLGNRDLHGAAPCGNYRCKGKDRWVSITVRDDQEWKGFCRVLGNPEWTKNGKFSTALSRYKNQDELDKLVENWTLNHDHYAVMFMLQKEGVAAAPVADTADIYSDPHVRESGVLEEVTHPEAGTHIYAGIGWRQAMTPNSIRRYAYRLGEDNEYVYKELLGISDEEYAELEREGHIGKDFAPHVGP